MRKTVTLALSIIALLAVTACSSPEKRVRSAAEGFLSAYYSGDYDKAATFCTPRMAAFVSRWNEDLDRIPGETVQKMKEAAMQTSFRIVSVTLDREAGKAVVSYELSLPDSSLPVPKELSLEIEGRTASVDGIE